jgi:GTP-binding protein
VVGRPNVGKSSLFNRLTGTRQAITHETAGTTRDANFANVDWRGRRFALADTAGLSKAGNEIEVAAQEQIRQVADIADMLVVVVDAGMELTTEDLEAARVALRSKKPVILALGKADTMGQTTPESFRRLGIPTIIPVSAVHGRGTGDLLDAIASMLPKEPKLAVEETPPLKLALIGRPNVGKSSLLNSLVGKQAAVVSNMPGTTRDTSSSLLKYHGREIEILDTAGLRRRGRIEQGIEKFSALRTVGAINQADICILVMDAHDGVAAGDLNLAGQIIEAGKGLIIVMNKWDAVEDKENNTQAQMTARIQSQFQFVWWAPLVFTSATTGLHVARLMELAVQIDARRHTKLATGPLNRFIEKLIDKLPPSGLKGRLPKLNYVTQTDTNPPTFTFFCTYPDLVHWGYKRYLENNLREEHDFVGTPIRFEFRHKHEDAKFITGQRKGAKRELTHRTKANPKESK